jgi:hypothetical protein
LTITAAIKIKYLTNRELLEQIHASKNTYCSYLENIYSSFDIITQDLNLINLETLEQAKIRKAELQSQRLRKEAQARGEKNPVYRVDPDSLDIEQVVVRLMTYDHIPPHPIKHEMGKTVAERHIKINFPAFQHFIWTNDCWVCVGKSHWRGGLQNGEFCNNHGYITPKLAMMFMKLVEKYSKKGNWRGYCVDDQTQALTQRGWLNTNEINETDIILSYETGDLKWSKIKSIYRGDFDGLMHKVTCRSIDSLITPNHKIVTARGLIPIEQICENDKIVVMGNAEKGNDVSQYADSLVELAGWIITEGCYDYDRQGNIKSIAIYQNPGANADKIRKALETQNFTFTENLRKNNICFRIWKSDSKTLENLFPNKNIPMSFILELTNDQRELLLQTLIAGDGWNRKTSVSWVQKDQGRTDMFQALCTLLGKKTNSHKHTHVSFGKETECITTNVFSSRANNTTGACLNLHGGKRNGRSHPGRGKAMHPNEPTTYYQGQVWCPETEYGCFVARRNGKVYLTGNTYNEEMQGQALLQLSQIGLQFDESRSENPFAYYTSAVQNSFTRILNTEKRNQNIRDDLLIMHGSTPSYTRQTENEIAQKTD